MTCTADAFLVTDETFAVTPPEGRRAVFVSDPSAGELCEGTGTNVFVVRDGVVRTPPVSSGALPGITRDTVLTLAREQGLTCVEENLVRTDLYNADEVFLTGTSAGLVPVISVDRRTVGDGKPGETTRTLADMFGDVVHGRVDLHPEWREPVG